ncbi:hypothetical protein [Altererythrobacter sp. ZODW24]|uniref:hypothetical protein n=1 Tax=Altererythrobacter sp. ZODW24 TaxID=2185142 RepID=UPI0013B3B48B|nr:hypothetical protein [Altererythrobacter sp. ZODW24]
MFDDRTRSIPHAIDAFHTGERQFLGGRLTDYPALDSIPVGEIATARWLMFWKKRLA